MRTHRWSTVVASRTLAVALAAVLVPALAGCGSEEAAAPEPKGCRQVTGDAFTIVAKDMAFTDPCLTMPPGSYDVTFDNDDEGTGHDLHIQGAGVDEVTRLTVGPDQHALSVDLTVPGTYRYTCDPHGNMVGTIVVTEPAPTTTAGSDPTSASTPGDGATTTAGPTTGTAATTPEVGT